MSESFEAFYEREFQAVFRTVWLLCRDRSLAEDVAQEAFARTLERWRRIKDQPWRGGYVTTIAVNLVRHTSRRRPAVPLTEGDDERDAEFDIWEAVANLPKRERQATVLFYRLDMPIEQIARAMGCRVSTVRAHLTRARRHLQRLVSEEDEEFDDERT